MYLYAQLIQCIEYEEYFGMATQANLYKSQHSAHLVDRISSKMCNNLLVVQNYLHEKIIAPDLEIFLVKHTEKSSKEVKVNIDISVMKMHMFLTYFHDVKKKEYVKMNYKIKKAVTAF